LGLADLLALHNNLCMADSSHLTLHDPAGDEERARAEVEQLFREHYRGLCGCVLDYVHSMDAAEEIVQEMFLKVWDIVRDGDARTITRSYLYAAARNHAVSVLRHERVVQAHEETSAVQAASEPTRPTIEDHLIADELTRAVRDAVDRMPERRRQVFRLSRERGLTYAEIAHVLGISPKTVELHMTAAFKSLRASLRGFT
jgi:RNA polymerase sigma-70 factor (ECF subfamily)